VNKGKKKIIAVAVAAGPGYALPAFARRRKERGMRVFLETERLLLRRFTESDVANLHDLHGDPEVMRFVNGGRPVPRDVTREETLPRFLRAYERFEGFGVWATIERSTGEFVGWFEFYPRKDTVPEEVELGYRLRRSAWGKGFATEGSRALIRKGFTELGVRRVVAETMAVNTASRRVMEKSGLTYVRTFHQEWPERIEGEEHGDVEYALTKADWGRQVTKRGRQ
jgi:RimJ/RimL family protein N-acetyltransferase